MQLLRYYLLYQFDPAPAIGQAGRTFQYVGTGFQKWQEESPHTHRPNSAALLQMSSGNLHF